MKNKIIAILFMSLLILLICQTILVPKANAREDTVFTQNWASIPPIVTDPVGDGYSHEDLTAASVTHDGVNLYIKVDFVHHEQQYYHRQFNITLQTNGGSLYVLNVIGDELSGNSMYLMGAKSLTETVANDNSGIINYYDQSHVLWQKYFDNVELSIPLADLGNPSSIDMVFWGGYSFYEPQSYDKAPDSGYVTYDLYPYLRTIHAPIEIYDDSQFTYANGVTGGTGTKSDPYIIANWKIIGDSPYINTAIDITSTNSYVVIRNCEVSSANGIIYANNNLQNMPSIVITNCTINGCNYGIMLSDTNATIENCVISDNQLGVLHSNSDLGLFGGVSPFVLEIHFCNIVGNKEGIEAESATVDATNNWWGANDGPSGISSGSGDSIFYEYPDVYSYQIIYFSPWLTAPLFASSSQTGTDATLSFPDSGVTTDLSGTAEVHVATYESIPQQGLTDNLNNYIDVYAPETSSLAQMTIKVSYTLPLPNDMPENSLKLSWFDGTNWVQCSPNTGVNTQGKFVWAVIDAHSTPSLNDLGGTLFGVALVYPVAFTETGLPIGTPWTVTFDGLTQSSTTTTSTFTDISAGSYTWSVANQISAGTGTRYVTSTSSGTIDVPTQTTQDMLYTPQYQVGFLVNPTSAGSINPTNSRYYDLGFKVPVSATPNSGYTFYSWKATPTSSITFSDNIQESTTAIINGPGTVTATFAKLVSGNQNIALTGSNNIIVIAGGNNNIDCSQATSTTIVKTGNGNNIIKFGDGDNVFKATATGNDIITSGNGNNNINIFGNGNNQITTGSGNDQIQITGNGNNIINAGSGSNIVTVSGTGNNQITAGSGNDVIIIGGGSNIIKAGDGNNQVTAGNGNNQITTGIGNDAIVAGNGNNNVQTGAGDDTIKVGNGNNIIDGGAGYDTCVHGTGNNTILNCEKK